MSLRLDLIVRTYDDHPGWPESTTSDRWSWRLWSGSRIVSTSGSQRYSRRIDCARGAEVGAGVLGVQETVQHDVPAACRWLPFGDFENVDVRILDER